MSFELQGISDGTYFIYVPIGKGRLLIGRLVPEKEGGRDGWAIYFPSDGRYGWHEDGMTILPGYVDECRRSVPEWMQAIEDGASVQSDRADIPQERGGR